MQTYYQRCIICVATQNYELTLRIIHSRSLPVHAGHLSDANCLSRMLCAVVPKYAVDNPMYLSVGVSVTYVVVAVHHE